MKLKYLGTAAAEGIPSVFCGCAVCQEARKMKGRYFRTRSQVLIDDELLVDLNADTYAHALAYDIDLSQIGHVLITHVHEDHFYPAELANRQGGFAHKMKYPTLTLYGSSDVGEYARKIYEVYMPNSPMRLVETGRVAFETLRPYERRQIENFFITALPATHGTPHPYIYIIEKAGKTVLYFNDSGYLTEETMTYLREKKIRFDLVSYDCTWGKDDAGGAVGSHMGVPNNVEARRRFIQNGNYKDGTVDVITHFSHNIAGVGYGDMCKVAEENGFVLAYDGMQVEI